MNHDELGAPSPQLPDFLVKEGFGRRLHLTGAVAIYAFCNSCIIPYMSDTV